MVAITAFTVIPAWKVHTRGSTVALHKAIQTLINVCHVVKEQRDKCQTTFLEISFLPIRFGYSRSINRI